jgi:hypothetical protein
MHPIKLKKAHFNGNYILMSDGSISNGHWALRKTAIENYPLVCSIDVAAAFGIPGGRDADTSTFETLAPTAELTEWAALAWVWNIDEKSTNVRVFRNEAGELATFDARYLRMIDADQVDAKLYGHDPHAPFVDAATISESSLILMPTRIEITSLIVQPKPEPKPE